jgi:lipoate-protein ligase A
LLLFTEAHRDEPVLDLAITHALLRRVGAGELPAAARVYRPAATLAFGRQDTLLPGYPAAREVARAHGFAPFVRLGGGHAAAYDDGAVVLDLIAGNTTLAEGIEQRFAHGTELVAAALRDAGVDAVVGELPGEYCAGRWSVHGGGVKLAGTAQRAIRGAALMTAVLLVAHGARLRAALTDVYDKLEIAWDPATAGAAEDVAAGVTVEAVERALLARLEPYEPATLDAATRALAVELEPAHRA